MPKQMNKVSITIDFSLFQKYTDCLFGHKRDQCYCYIPSLDQQYCLTDFQKYPIAVY